MTGPRSDGSGRDRGRRAVRAALWIAALAFVLAAAATAGAADSYRELQKEKARLTEARKKAEATARELSETLRREKSARHKVADLQTRLSRQRRQIARIDAQLAGLSRKMEEAESEVRSLEHERASSYRGLGAAAARVFVGMREKPPFPVAAGREERMRFFAGRVLDSEAGRYARLTEDKERREAMLLGLEREVRVSERKFSREKQAGDRLLAQRRTEAERLQGIRAEKEKKEKELRALRARIAGMETLVSRIERKVREEERARKEKAAPAGPSLFSAVPGGILAPVRGRVVGRFGKHRDPVFDVDVENRGIEIEASSGAPIRSIGKGKVVFSGSVAGFGKVLILQHGSGLFSVYGRAESFSVAQDQEVVGGETIGRLPRNPNGKSVLYLELRAGGTAIDPMGIVPLSRQ
jgi:murein hydrolase activator